MMRSDFFAVYDVYGAFETDTEASGVAEFAQLAYLQFQDRLMKDFSRKGRY